MIPMKDIMWHMGTSVQVLAFNNIINFWMKVHYVGDFEKIKVKRKGLKKYNFGVTVG